MRKLSLLFMAGCAIYLSSCGGDSSNAQQESQAESETQQVANTEQVSQKIEAGQKVYNQYCIACHQQNGGGVPGAFPPLTQTEWVLGEKDTLISIVLNGLQGPITVNGEQYNNVMTAHNFLTDDEVANVLTFVRKSFGNDASEVTAEEVAAIRNKQ